MLTYEEEMDLKYGISGKMSPLHSWEVERIAQNIIMEHEGCDTENNVFTGFKDFDSATRGFHRGETYLLAARPAMGKTAFAISLMSNLLREGEKKVLYISLEMSRERIVQRLLDTLLGNNICSGCCYAEENYENNLESAGSLLAEHGKNLFIDDRPGMSVEEIFEDCAEMGETDLIIIDYLQLVSEPDYNEITQKERWALCCEDLELLAKEYNCSVLILSQLSRAVEARRDHRPRIEDVTGLVPGRSVDNVIFLYRDEYYFRDSANKGRAEFYFAKRKGIGSSQMVVTLEWKADKCLFTDIS